VRKYKQRSGVIQYHTGKIVKYNRRKNLKNFTDEFLLMTSGFKFKTAKMTERVFTNGGINISQGSIIFYLFMVILIFYLIGYIGLLRVFNDSFGINKNELTVKLCL
jgi:hypothetical protein